MKKQNVNTPIPPYERSEKELRQDKLVIALAWVNIFVLPILVVVVPFLFGDTQRLALGIGCLIYAVYEWIGSICKWKHFYCSYQNMRREPMTPDHIEWDKVNKITLYIPPFIWTMAGIILCLLA